MNELLEGHEQLMQQGQQILQEGLLQKVGEVNVTRSFNEPLEGFPLNTLDQFDEMESDSQRSARKKMYHHLKSLGGSKLRDFLHSSLKEIMTDELVNKFTWSGGAESRNFGDTKIANILYLAAQNCPFFKGPESKMEFKIDMQEVLRAAKQRIRNRIKKNAIVTEEQDPEDDGTDDEKCTSEEMTEYESDN
ncbi:uncharacterized protein LOC143901928 [Temnothorax americanus]|uniref:uncharacterized protein LOC143901928 n=1 Tax=Temnothorax americanus TaxID=1964332 RepID=UPI0040694383